jgi:tetratricopeptide (TPR) repeat protein
MLASDKSVTHLTAYKIAEVFSVEDNAERLNLLVELYEQSNQYDKFLLLPNLSKTAIIIKDIDAAQKYSDELISLAGKYKDSWNYGNAIHDANMVLGLIELDSNNIAEAKHYLLKAGRTSGSPQLANFGPNLLLAKALLDIGEKQVVIEYFQLLKAVWKNNDNRLTTWITSLEGGGTPYLENYLTR